MSISSIGSSQYGHSVQQAQQSTQASEVRETGPDRDGDSDDMAAKAVQAASAPTSNASGQQIGTLINVTA